MNQDAISALQKAGILLKSREDQAAQSLLEKKLKDNPNFEEGWYLISFTYQELDQNIYALRRALQINPDFREAQERLGKLVNQVALVNQTALEKQELSPDHEIEGTVFAEVPTEAESPFLEAEVLIANGNLEAARRLLRVYLQTHPNDSQGWYTLSLAEPTRRGQINDLRQA